MAEGIDFPALIERIKLNLDIDNEEICLRLGIGQVTLSNYLSGYVRPPAGLITKALSAFSSASLAEDGGETLLPEIPARTLPLDELRQGLVQPRRFCVPVKDNSLSGERVFEGSIAVIELCRRPKDGDIILLSLDGGEALLYKFSSRDGKVVLRRDGETTLSREDFDKRARLAGRLVCTLDRTVHKS